MSHKISHTAPERLVWRSWARPVSAFALALSFFLTVAGAQPPPAELPPVDRVIAVGDVHGDYDQYLAVLRDAGIINKANRWIAGTTHFVQLGDIPDRGPDTRKIISLLQHLQKVAERKKGAVHVLIGNHEAMNVYGDFRYVHPGEFEAFVTRQSKRIQMLHWENGVNWIKENKPEEEWPEFDEAHRQAWFEQYPQGFVELAQAWSPGGEIFEWMKEHNAVMKIGDTLFMHGGLGPAYLDWTISEINDSVREALANEDASVTSILRNEDGPLWYRGLAQKPEHVEGAHVDALLEAFEVKRIILGHTPQLGIIMPRFDGKVILADVGMSAHYGHGQASVLIENGMAYAIHHGNRVKLPTEGGLEGTIEYLEKIAAIDPDPSRIQRVIRATQAAIDARDQALLEPESPEIEETDAAMDAVAEEVLQ